ncbi:hypothetical protein FRC04_008745 [Tulasnella sp. 424]|nr:hypothetical protein FRC04_008745 [Tulasnella sp. 424]
MYVVEARVTSFNPPQPIQPAPAKSRGKKAKAAPPPPDAWPHPSTFKANPSTLAQAGFFYPDRNDPNASGIVDEVECFMCGHTLGGWEEQDDPHYEHAKRVKQTKCSWALAVAEAGFVYTPTASSPDMATCPYCQTAFADWEMDDVPLALHQKKRPNCPIFTGKVFDPNETMDGPDEVDFLTPVAPTTTSRKASTQKGSSRKPSSAALNQSQRAPATASRQPNAETGTSTKGKRLTRAASTAKPNVIDEASEPEAESEVIPPPPPKPTKKATRGKSSVVPSANPLAKSTRSKKVAAVPTPPEVKEEEEDEPMEASDFEAAPAPPPKTSGHGRSRTQPQGQIQRQAPSRDASRPQPEEDENAAGPSRGASNRSQSVQKASGGAVKGSRHPTGQAPDSAVEVNGAKVSRKKQAPRPPSPEEDEEMEEPEPEPVAKPPKKTKTNAKKATKKAEPVVEDDFDALPPPAPEPPSKPKPGKKASPPEVVVPSRKIESLEKPSASAKSKEMNKVPFPTIATPEPEVEAEPEPEEVAPPKAKPKKGGKNTAKSKKATKKAKTPEPEPPSPEANEMEVDDIVESTSNQVTEPEPEPDSEPGTEAEDLSGTEASVPTEQSEVEEPGLMEEDRPNLPLVDSGAINKATGAIQASAIAPVKGKVNGIIPLERAKSPQRTPKANALSNAQQQTTPKPAVQDKPDVRMASPELAPPPPEVTFTAEERKMTLIEYVRKQMQEAYEHLKADGERELQSFDERAEEVRRQLEAL